MPIRPTGKRRPVGGTTPAAPGDDTPRPTPAGPGDAPADALPIGDEALREELSGGAPTEASTDAAAADARAAHEAAARAEADAAADLTAAAREVRESREDAEEEGPATRPSGRRESWRRRSATGAILTGFAMGLQEVFEPEKKEPAIVMETSGDPPRDLPVEAELELATTRRSVVRIRPWLLDEGSEEAGGGAAGDRAPDAPAAGGHRLPEAADDESRA
jgi:hypothetical protein